MQPTSGTRLTWRAMPSVGVIGAFGWPRSRHAGIASAGDRRADRLCGGRHLHDSRRAGASCCPTIPRSLLPSSSARSNRCTRAASIWAWPGTGSDQRTAQALRRNLSSDPDEFPARCTGTSSYFSPIRPARRCARCPAPGSTCRCGPGLEPVCAQLAAAFGCRMPLPRILRGADDGCDRGVPQRFRPSRDLANLRDARLQRVRRRLHGRGEIRATSMQQAFVKSAQRPSDAAAGRRRGYPERVGPQERAISIRCCRVPQSALLIRYPRICAISSSEPARMS